MLEAGNSVLDSVTKRHRVQLGFFDAQNSRQMDYIDELDRLLEQDVWRDNFPAEFQMLDRQISDPGNGTASREPPEGLPFLPSPPRPDPGQVSILKLSISIENVFGLIMFIFSWHLRTNFHSMIILSKKYLIGKL
jgi:hypothetical protein